MKIDIRKYKESNLVVVDVKSDKDKLLNIIVIFYSDDKREILFKKAYTDKLLFADKIEYNILKICGIIVEAYGDKGDLEKLWLAEKLFNVINYNE